MRGVGKGRALKKRLDALTFRGVVGVMRGFLCRGLLVRLRLRLLLLVGGLIAAGESVPERRHYGRWRARRRGEGGRDVDLGGLIGLDKSRTSMRVLSESRANLKASSGLDFFWLHFCPFAHQDSSRFSLSRAVTALKPEGY